MIASLYSGVNTRLDGRGAGSAPGDPDDEPDWFLEGVDTYT
ncbi:hypothetical protein [Micromonospora sp. NBC_01412]